MKIFWLGIVLLVPSIGLGDAKSGKNPEKKKVVEVKKDGKDVTKAAVDAPGAKKKERVIDFTKEEEIRGVLVKPEGELVGARRKVSSKSLIPVRLHFIPEMMKTLQEL